MVYILQPLLCGTSYVLLSRVDQIFNQIVEWVGLGNDKFEKFACNNQLGDHINNLNSTRDDLEKKLNNANNNGVTQIR